MTGFPAAAGMSDNERTDEYFHDGIHIHRFHHAYTPMGGQTSRIAIGFDNHLAAGYFSRVIEAFRPNLVHFFHFNRLGTGLIDRAVEAGVPAYFTPTDFWTICPTAQLVYGDGKSCPGPSPSAGNCVVHLAGNTVGGRLGRLVWRLPAVVGEALVRLSSTRVISDFRYAEEVKALSVRLGLNVKRLNELRAIIAPNRMMQQLMVRYGVRPDRVIVAAYGVVEVDLGSSAARAVPDRPLRVGFIGTLAPHKGCHVLLQAFQRLPPGRAILKIYGSAADFPEYSEGLRRLAMGVDGIQFWGTFPNNAIGEIFDQLDLLVIPSVWNENTPLVLYSAQAARCPILASNVPGIAAAVQDGVDGVLFEPGNPCALASELRRVVESPDLLVEMSRASRAPKPVSKYVDELIDIWSGRVFPTDCGHAR